MNVQRFTQEVLEEVTEFLVEGRITFRRRRRQGRSKPSRTLEGNYHAAPM